MSLRMNIYTARNLTFLALLKLVVCSLRFNSEHGSFKILQVADMHFANGVTTKCLDVLPDQYATCSDMNTTAFIERMIRAEKPDLIVFTGDNIYASDSMNPVESLELAFAAAVNSKLPWAAVLGNHDQESSLNRAGVMSHIVKMNFTVSQMNPPDVTSIDEFGNYNLEVHGAHGTELENETILNLYFVDSGDYSRDPKFPGYGWIQASQQSWFKNTSKSLQTIPALVYFHIPLPEVNNFTGNGDVVGVKQEHVSSPLFNSGFFKTLVETGDVKAVFTGHDHVNDFCGKLEGVHLCYGGGFGYHAYGKAGWSRRARVVKVTLGTDGPTAVKEIKTWKRLDDVKLSRIDEQVLWKIS